MEKKVGKHYKYNLLNLKKINIKLPALKELILHNFIINSTIKSNYIP